MNPQPVYTNPASSFMQMALPAKNESPPTTNVPPTQSQPLNLESNETGEIATLRLMILQRDYIIRNYYTTIMTLQSQIQALTSGRTTSGTNLDDSSLYVNTAGSPGNPYSTMMPYQIQPQTNFQSSFISTQTAHKKSPPPSPVSPSSELSISEESQSTSNTPEAKLFGGIYSEYINNLKTICTECSLHGRLKSKKKPLVDSLLLLSFFHDGVHKNEHGGYQIDNENITREKMNSISVLIRPPSRGTNHSYENWKRAMGKTFKKDGNTFTPKDENSRRYINHVEEHLQKISTAKKLAEASMELEQ